MVAKSVPDSLGTSEAGGPRLITRHELKVWRKLVALERSPLTRFGDTGIWSPRQLDTGGGGGPPPARVRIPVGDQQIFFKSEAAGYRALCEEALRYPGINALPRCWGLAAIRECAAGSGSIDNASGWVARDTNMHIETTVVAVQEHLARTGRLREVALAPVRSTPWQQETLLDELRVER